ncbi:MAG: hypothetical protein HY549_06060 [Elusimicrobia bacterium]|nr:hypothetical protein [Elusimicrobiota bacterium]
MFFSKIPEMTVEQLKEKLDKKERFILLDVREPREHQQASIPQAKLVPMAELPNRLGELDKSQEIAVMCKAGGRSARVTKMLRENGFNAVNVAGGIDAWSDRIDPSVPHYTY